MALHSSAVRRKQPCEIWDKVGVRYSCDNQGEWEREFNL